MGVVTLSFYEIFFKKCNVYCLNKSYKTPLLSNAIGRITIFPLPQKAYISWGSVGIQQHDRAQDKLWRMF